MTVPAGLGALEATQQQVLSQLQSGISVTSTTPADTIATGSLTAAQPTAGTVVAGGTVSITLGTGQGTWEAQLTGTFSSGTTIVFEGTDDSGTTTNWFTTVGYNTTVTNPPNITSVGGPGPFVIRGSASGYQQIRMRASALTISDSVSVRLIGSNAPLGLGGLSTNDGSFAKETGGNLASIKTDADSIVTNTTGLATQTTLASAKTDLDTIVTQTSNIAKETGGNLASAKADLDTIVTQTSGLATQTTLAAIKTDADSIVTNTTGLATASNQSTTNTSLSTIVTNTGRIPAQGAATTSASTPVNIASDQTVPTKTGFSEQASLSAGSLNADLVASTDVSSYRCFSLQITGTWSGTITFQCSNDNTNFSSLAVITSNPASVGMTSTTTANGFFLGAINFRYLRVRMTSYSSGTANGTLELYTQVAGTPLPLFFTNVSQQGTWTIQPGNTANSTPWLVNQPGSDVTVFASGAQTATQTQSDQTNNSAKGIKVVLDMTNVTSSPSVTLEIDGKDAASGKYYSILTGAAVTTVSINVYTIYPGLTVSANSVANDVLPHTWRIKVTANNSNSGTYSVGASLLP